MFVLQFHWFNSIIIITIVIYFLVCVVKNRATFVKVVKNTASLYVFFIIFKFIYSDSG